MFSIAEQLNRLPEQATQKSESFVTPIKIKRLYAKYVIDAWFSDYKMGWVVHRVAEDIGLDATDAQAVYAHAEKYLKAKVFSTMPVRAWVRTNYRNLSDDMWGCKNTEKMYARMAKLLGAPAERGTGGSLVVDARKADTRTQWKVCS